MAPRKNGPGKVTSVPLPLDSSENDSGSANEEQESLEMQPPPKRTRKEPSTSTSGKKQPSALPTEPLAPALPQEGQRLTRRMLQRVVAGGLGRRSQLMETGLDIGKRKRRDKKSNLDEQKSTTTLKSSTLPAQPVVPPPSPEPAKAEVAPLQSKAVKKIPISKNSGIKKKSKKVEVEVDAGAETTQALEPVVPPPLLTEDSDDGEEFKIPASAPSAEELDEDVQIPQPAQTESGNTGTTEQNSGMFYSLLGDSNSENTKDDSLSSVYKTPTGSPVREVDKGRARRLDCTYIIRNAEDYESESDREIPEAEDSPSMTEDSIEEPRRPRDNYNITRFEDYDADDLSHRAGKAKPKWAATGETINSQVYLCRPDLLKLVPKYAMGGGHGIFPAANPQKKLFPFAVPRRQRHEPTKK